MKCLVVGAGSIGKRHLRNLRALGISDLAVCDSNRDCLIQVNNDLGIKTFSHLDKALDSFQPNMVLICTPPMFHIPQALQAVKANAHVFIEKPLSHNLDGVDNLIAEANSLNRIVQVGYNLRFHPGIQKVKQLVEMNLIGKIIWAQIEFGQYLPDWHPNQDYRQVYSAKQLLGGGIILDDSHEVDYVVWFLGQPISLVCMAGKVSDLDIDVEDCATILLRYKNGAQVDIHMDFVQRGYARSCKLAGEWGTIKWDYKENCVQVYQASTNSWEIETYSFNSNDMYFEEMKHFLDCVENHKKPLVDIVQAKIVLEIVMAAKLSAAQCSKEYISL